MNNYILNNENLQHFLSMKHEIINNNLLIYYQTAPKAHICPICGKSTSKIHDYRIQKIKQVPLFNYSTTIVLRKRRYCCHDCGKKFYETYDFLPKYFRITKSVIECVLNDTATKISFTDIARKYNISITTVLRIFSLINYDKPKLPEVLGIDEFKGNANGEKYQCIITDIKNRQGLDILQSRKKTDLIDYFKAYSKEERSNVKFLIMDMWKGYSNISWLFPNAKIVVDKYHYIRQIYWALNNVRKKVQKRFTNEKRLHFKHSKGILSKRYSKLSDNNKTVLRLMLDQDGQLYDAWQLKEWFADIMELNNKEQAEKELHNWILSAEESGIPEFESCIKAIRNWFGGITNSFNYNYTNGFTEGCNNFIKVIKRISFGIRDFNRLRNKVLHTMKKSYKYKQKRFC